MSEERKHFLVPVFFNVEADDIRDAFVTASEVFVSEEVGESTTVHTPIDITGMSDETIARALSEQFKPETDDVPESEGEAGGFPASPVGLIDAAIGSLTALRDLVWSGVGTDRQRVIDSLSWALGERLDIHVPESVDGDDDTGDGDGGQTEPVDGVSNEVDGEKLAEEKGEEDLHSGSDTGGDSSP